MLPRELVDRAVASHPLPVADAVGWLVSAETVHEQRDRVVEVFRAILRYVGALALAARLADREGLPPEGEARRLLEALRRRALTDGQWVALTRELRRPHAERPEGHPLPRLLELFHGKRTRLPKDLDQPLGMLPSSMSSDAYQGNVSALSTRTTTSPTGTSRGTEMSAPAP